MADLVITAANVKPTSGYSFVDGVAGEALTAGQVVYQNASDSKFLKANASGTLAQSTVKGIALNGASLDQPVRVMTGGELDLGAIMTNGEIYVAAGTAGVAGAAGGIAPEGDLAATERVSLIGVATSTSKLQVRIQNSGALL